MKINRKRHPNRNQSNLNTQLNSSNPHLYTSTTALLEGTKCLLKPTEKAKAALEDLLPRKRKNDSRSKSTTSKKAHMNKADNAMNDATMSPSLLVASARSCQAIVRTKEEEEALHDVIEVIRGTVPQKQKRHLRLLQMSLRVLKMSQVSLSYKISTDCIQKN
jgi:hypothetical protein